MTVGVIYRVPNVGAIVASDGRITQAGHIVTDIARKFIICGSTVAVLAGEVGPTWRRLQEAPPKSFAAFLKAVDTSDDDTDFLAWDRTRGRLWSGSVPVSGAFAALGSGDALALGALEALPLAKTLEAAEACARKAVQIAAKHHTGCGGRTRVVVVQGARGPVIVR